MNEAAETLGVLLAPDGSTTQQVELMKQKAKDWVSQMQAGNLTREELWTSLQTTIWRTLTYPLPCTQLTKNPVKLCLACHGDLQTFPM
jgi:hypothetical protein